MFLFVKRYLLAKKSHSVVNVITVLSLFSIALPVAAVVILLSIFNGFSTLLESTNRVVDPDLRVTLVEGKRFAQDSIDSAKILDIEGVEAVSYALEQSMLFEHNGVQSVATLRGVDSAFVNVGEIKNSIARGEYCVELGELDRLVLGGAMAYKLGINTLVDTFIDVYALKSKEFSPLLPMSNYKRKRVKLSAVYTSDMQTEEQYIFSSLRLVQTLMGAQGEVSQLNVKLSPAGAKEQERVQSEIARAVGSAFKVQNRREMNPMVYGIVEYEKWGMLIISILVMVLASFTLIGALSMLIVEKRDDVRTLRAMGGSWSFVRRIFLCEGLLVSGIGIALGALIGCVVALMQQWYGFVKLPSQNMLMDSYPVHLLASDVAIVIVVAFAIAALLSYVVVNQMIKKDKK